MQEQVKSALRYPSFVVAAMAVAMVIVNIFVIPAFANVFKGFGAELPLMTRLLIGFSDFMVGWWHALLLGIVVAAFFGFNAWRRTVRGALHLGSLQAADSDCRENYPQSHSGPLCRQFRPGLAQRGADHSGPEQRRGDGG
jgi:hypothetical protein